MLDNIIVKTCIVADIIIWVYVGLLISNIFTK